MNVSIRATRHISCLFLFTICVTYLSQIHCLHQDQVGKFDWRKQFIGIPKFVYSQQGLGNIIVGTESNVIASLNEKDGSILWRQLLPKGCSLNHMSILKSNDDHRDYLIRTACSSESGNISHVWCNQNGLIAGEERYRDIVEDDTAESVLTDQGHIVDGSRAFKVSDDISLIVNEEGQVILKAHGQTVWSREESLASIGNVEVVRLPNDMRDKFGLKKTIVLLTEKGKIFGIDTLTGDTIWQLFDGELSTRDGQYHTSMVIARQTDGTDLESRAIIVHSSGIIIFLNPVTGDVVEKKKFAHHIRQIVQTEFSKEHDLRGIILVDVQNNVHIYPDLLKSEVLQNIHKYYMTIVHRSPAILEGYKFSVESGAVVPEQVWTFPISKSEKIVHLSFKRIDEEIHSPARVLGDRGILYKYTNPNLIAIMTQGTTGVSCSLDHSISIYLVDGVTGSLVHSVYHPKSRGPSNMVHSENWLVYSFYNVKHRRTEISSLEMFEGVTQVNSSEFSSLSRSHIKPKLIEHKTFIFPTGIDAMIDTVTLRGMTNRHIIVATPSGGLLEIPKIFLDPRRPINMLMEHREEGLVPYMPELPVPSESMINYDKTLLSIRKITASPSDLESTSLVLAYGLDLFFTRVTPSKTFDILKDDFDHLLITGVLVFLVVASHVCKLLAQRKALYASWK